MYLTRPLQNDPKNERIKYGEFIILGYNGKLPEGDRGRRRSKIELYRRENPNGVIQSGQYNVTGLPSDQLCNHEKDIYSISYVMKDHSVVVEYFHDENTDMFQIGRSSESPIDFVVLDTTPGNTIVDRNAVNTPQTISRFACRILASREVHNPSVKLCAAGFDSSKKIFLGNNATIWQKLGSNDSCVHGLTTNGVLIMKPIGLFCDNFEKETNTFYPYLNSHKRKSPLMPGTWREVSVDGNIFGRREPRSAIVEGIPVPTENNNLIDGTLIDLCGATLLWRSADGLNRSPSIEHLNSGLSRLSETRVCSTNIFAMVFPKRNSCECQNSTTDTSVLFVFISCGHVEMKETFSSFNKNASNEICPFCNIASPVAQLCLGVETAFYIDYGPPEYCFVPCGHMVNEETAKYWANTPIPCGKSGFYSACPFCATPLDGSTGYIKLIF